MVFVVRRKVKKSSMDKTLKVILHNILHKGYSGDLSLSRLPFNVVVILQCYIPLYYLKNVISTKFCEALIMLPTSFVTYNTVY